MASIQFGTKEEHVDYQTRYGVYAVIAHPEEDKILLVQAPNGAWFLPGGEIEEGEDHLTALARELMEELGFTAQIDSYYGQADEYFYSSHRDTYFYNPAYIYQVTQFQQVSAPLEEGNTSAWFSPDQAIAHLKRGSHQWGIHQWKEEQNQEKD